MPTIEQTVETNAIRTSGAPEALISMRNIWKTYQMGVEELHALRGVSFEVQKGEYLAIIGPSGSGKSTLMNLIGCLDSPSKGQYWINGNLVSAMTDDELASIRNKEIGFVFQTFNLLARATAVITTKTAENVVSVPIQAVIEKKPDAAISPSLSGDSIATVAANADKPKTIKGVFVLDGNKAKFVEVQTGITGESDIQITSGLSEGQEVITGPSRILNTLKEGAIVKRQIKKEGAEIKS